MEIRRREITILFLIYIYIYLMLYLSFWLNEYCLFFKETYQSHGVMLKNNITLYFFSIHFTKLYFRFFCIQNVYYGYF